MSLEEEQRLRKALEAATSKMVQQDQILRQLNESPHALGTVVDLQEAEGRMTVSVNGSQYDIVRREDAVLGDRVILVQNTLQVLKVLKSDVPVGRVATVRSLPRQGMAEVSMDGTTYAVRSSLPGLNEGDRVVVDPNGTAVLGLVDNKKTPHGLKELPRVRWDDIGGQEEAKGELREAIELPVTRSSLFKRYGKRPVKGILLYGPPGTGKTMLGKAAATALADVHNASSPDGFIYVKGPALLSKWLGESEANVRGIFAAAREFKRRNGYPAVVFLDEADALLFSRDEKRSVAAQTVVPQFLAEMDGLEDSAALFILATNRPTDLDPAVVRDGRIDRKVRVGRPDEKVSATIAQIHLNGRPLKGSDLAAFTASQIFDAGRKLGRVGSIDLALSDAVSGAMIEGIVERASSRAMMRDIAANDDSSSGIEQADISWAVDKEQSGMKDIDLRSIAQEKAQAA